MSEKQERYSTWAMILHWVLALALAAEIAIGFAMPKDASGFELYQLHKSIGITILLVSLIRLAWRLQNPPPETAEAGITGLLSKVVHWSFYGFMILMPLTGWMIVSTASIDIPTMVWGIAPLPHLPLPDSLNGLVEQSHWLLAWGGIALFVLHLAGALRHQFLLKDNLMARMSPGGSGVFAMIMAGVVIFLGLLVFVRSGDVESVVASPEESEDTAMPAPATPSAPEEDSNLGEETVSEDVMEDDTEEEEAGEDSAEEAEEAEVMPQPPEPPPSWTIQLGGSLRFSVDNAGSALNGGFNRWDGSIVMNPDDPSTARIRIEIDLASATLGDSTQDRMLRGADFLGAGSNPTAVWRSLSVRSLGGGEYEANGTLSLRGVSRPQRIRFSLAGEGEARSVTGNANIDRTAFGVGTGENAANLAPMVRVNFAFDATR